MDNNKIGKFIASLRKEKGLTQQELGDKLYVTDKAVSKWERGISLPDISILDKLAEILDTDIYSILQIKKKKNIDLEKVLEEERTKIKKQLKKKVKIITIPIIIIIFIIFFKFASFGYDIIHVNYFQKKDVLVNLGVPKFSFMMKNNENSYSFKNLRSKNVLKNEVKNFLNTLDRISCNDTVYYYDIDSDTTIIDYSIKGNFLYNTISYNVRNGNYCTTLEMKEYQKKLKSFVHTFYNEDTNFFVRFYTYMKTVDNENIFTAEMRIYYLGKNEKLIEESKGTFEIIGDELIYYRDKIERQNEKLEIPAITTFVLKKQKLILMDNYLQEYDHSIILGPEE